VTLDHEPANEIGTSMLAELEQFATASARLPWRLPLHHFERAQIRFSRQGGICASFYRGAAPLPEKNALQVFVFLGTHPCSTEPLDAAPL